MWKEKYNKESSDGATHNVTMELWIDFPETIWNKNTESPVLILEWHDKKTVTFWKLCKQRPCSSYPMNDCKECKTWYSGLQRRCTIKFNYFQRMPEHIVYSKIKDGSSFPNPDIIEYEDLTLEYCMKYAKSLLKQKLEQVIEQL